MEYQSSGWNKIIFKSDLLHRVQQTWLISRIFSALDSAARRLLLRRQWNRGSLEAEDDSTNKLSSHWTSGYATRSTDANEEWRRSNIADPPCFITSFREILYQSEACAPWNCKTHAKRGGLPCSRQLRQRADQRTGANWLGHKHHLNWEKLNAESSVWCHKIWTTKCNNKPPTTRTAAATPWVRERITSACCLLPFQQVRFRESKGLMKKSLCTGRAHLLAKSHRWLLDSHGLRQSSLRKCAVSVFYSAKYSTLVANVRNDTDNETADWIKDLELKQQRAFLDNLATKLGVKEVSSIHFTTEFK